MCCNLDATPSPPRSSNRRLAALAEGGLWGIEAYSSEISEENHDAIAELAAVNNLQVTGGSDNHGTLKVRGSCACDTRTTPACGNLSRF